MILFYSSFLIFHPNDPPRKILNWIVRPHPSPSYALVEQTTSVIDYFSGHSGVVGRTIHLTVMLLEAYTILLKNLFTNFAFATCFFGVNLTVILKLEFTLIDNVNVHFNPSYK